MRLYDTKSKLKKSVTQTKLPNNKQAISIYLCGPTVQSEPHIGHMRSGVIIDVLKNFLTYTGYNLVLCRNITDIDDKILQKASEQNIDWKDLAQQNIDKFHKAYKMLGIEKPKIEPKATDNINTMIELVSILIDKGHAYASETVSGNVYFSVKSFKEYGQLTHQDYQETQQHLEKDFSKDKRSHEDFALFKAPHKSEPIDASWETPWGKARPGWHIECSAMAWKYLGTEFSIHAGGVDLRFPHHENEIAQSTCAGFKFAQLWMHNGWVTVNGEKMSKSLGNFVSVSNFKNNPMALRYFLLTANYRSPLDYSNELYNDSVKAWNKICDSIFRVKSELGADFSNNKEADAVVMPKEFSECLENDFNTPKALAFLHKRLKVLNSSNKNLLATKKELNEILLMLKILGLNWCINKDMRSEKNTSQKAQKGDENSINQEYIKTKIAQRIDAKNNKNFTLADSIRDELLKKGIVLVDTKDGTQYSFKN